MTDTKRNGKANSTDETAKDSSSETSGFIARAADSLNKAKDLTGKFSQLASEFQDLNAEAKKAECARFDDVWNPMLASITRTAIDNLLAENPSKDEFYRRLWAFLQADEPFGSDDARKLALLVALSDERLPYIQIENYCTMDDSAYAEKMEALANEMAQLAQLVKRPFLQRTQEASAYLGVIERQPDYESKVLILSAILSHMQAQDDEQAETSAVMS